VESKGPEAGSERIDPGLSLVRLLSSAGVMKAAIDNKSAAENGASGRYTLVER
jgi:hypothetical protein